MKHVGIKMKGSEHKRSLLQNNTINALVIHHNELYYKCIESALIYESSLVDLYPVSYSIISFPNKINTDNHVGHLKTIEN